MQTTNQRTQKYEYWLVYGNKAKVRWWQSGQDLKCLSKEIRGFNPLLMGLGGLLALLMQGDPAHLLWSPVAVLNHRFTDLLELKQPYTQKNIIQKILTNQSLTLKVGGPGGGSKESQMSPQILCPDHKVPIDHQNPPGIQLICQSKE